MERLILGPMLALVQNDFTTLAIIDKLSKELSFSEADYAALEIGPACAVCDGTKLSHGQGIGHTYVPNPGRLVWKQEADQNKDVEVGPIARGIIIEIFKALDAAKKGTLPQLALYERFCGQRASEDLKAPTG